MYKKILSGLLVVVMIAALCSSVAFAQVTEVKTAGYFQKLPNWKISPSVPGTTCGLPGGDDADISKADYDTSAWIDAVAPSTVLGNLLDAGVYDDLFTSLTGTTDEWYNGQFNAVPSNDFASRWWYSTDIVLPATEAGKRVTLSIGGMSYHADMYVNGVLVKNTYTNITDPQDLWNGPLVDDGPYTSWVDSTGSNQSGTWPVQYGQQGLDAYKDEIVGSFRRFDIDITEYVHIDGTPNNIKFKILKPYSQQDFTYHWVDWHPRPVDSMMGLTGEVSISTSGPVRLNNPAVATKVTEDLRSAAVTLYCHATNLTDNNLTGTARAVVKDPDGNTVATVQKNVTIPSKVYNHEIAFKATDFPALTLANPQLWWPYMSGDQPLYTVDWSFTYVGTVSDSLTHRAGLREVNVDINVTPYFAQNAATITPGSGANMITFYFNHKPVMLRGGGYCPTDLFLRHDPVQNQNVIDNVLYSGFNMIRDEGKFFDNDLLDMCDEMGIVVFTGWCCCDRHQSPNNWTKCERFLGYEEQYAQTNNLRQHASGVLWFNGSDQAASYSQSSLANSWMVEEMYHVIEAKLRWDEIGITATSACLDSSRLLGSMNTGFHMDAGYNSQSHDYWFNSYSYNNIWGFISEGAGGAGIPAIETMKKVIPAGNLWPYNDSVAANNGSTYPTTSNYTAWNRLCAQRDNVGGGSYSSLNQYSSLMDNSYGASTSLESWHAKAYAQQLDQYRGQYESLDQHRYTNITGLVNWMLNGAKPSIYWQQFDFYGNPSAATFGAARANEPVHIMYNQFEHLVSVVNNTFDAYPNLTATMEIYNLDGELISTPLERKLDVAPDGVGETTVYGSMADYTPTGQLAKWAVKQPDGRWGFRNGWHYDEVTDTYTPMLYNYFGQITEAYGVNKLWDYDTIEASLTAPTSDVYFIRLQLKDSAGKVVSYNNYAVPMRSGFETHSQTNGAIRQGFDMTPLNTLPALSDSELTCVQIGSATVDGLVTQTLQVSNNSDVIAHNVYLAAYTDNTYKDLIGAVQYSDNLFILFPGETRTITVAHRASNLAGDAFINMTCYNNQIAGESPVRFKDRYTGQANGLGRSLSINKPVTISGGTNAANITAVTASDISTTSSPGGAIQHKTFIDSVLNSAATLTLDNPADASGSAWFTIDLGAPTAFDELMLHFNSGQTIRQRPNSFVIAGSDDNADWTELASADTNGSVMVDVILPATATYQYVKVTLTGAVSGQTSVLVSGCDIYAYSNYLSVKVAGDGTVTGGGKTITQDTYANQSVIVLEDGGVELTFEAGSSDAAVYVELDGVDVTEQLVGNVLTLAALDSDANLVAYFGTLADIRATEAVVPIYSPVEYTVSLANVKDANLVTLSFTADGECLNLNLADSYTALNGFSLMAPVTFENIGGDLWKGTVKLMYTGGFVSSAEQLDILTITGMTRGVIGNTTVTLTDISLVGKGEGGSSYLPCKINTSDADISVEFREKVYSKYDLNHDGAIDDLDLSIAIFFYLFDDASPDWETPYLYSDVEPCTPKEANVAEDDNVVDIADLIELWANFCDSYDLYPF